MKLIGVNTYGKGDTMGKKRVNKKDLVPQPLRKHVVAQEITSDFVLEIYEKAKRARSEKKKKEYLELAEMLSKHIGQLLVE